MANVRVAFEVLKGLIPEKIREVKVKPGFKYVRTHKKFDIKMDGKFTRKSRLVAGGHNMTPPYSITFSSVVTRKVLDCHL